jgi:Mg-chelatase subunit ChlD
MGMKRYSVLLLAFSCFAACAMAQGEPGRFAISQVTFQSAVLIAYVDVLSPDGRPPAKLAAADLSAAIAQRSLKIESVTPFSQSGDGVAYLFLVDISKSIARTQFNEMRTEIDAWIDGLTPQDRMAIFTFGEQERQLVDFSSDKNALHAAVQSIAPTDNLTRLYLALRNSIDIRQRTDADLPSRRVIVILSDGKDEGSGFTAEDVGRIFQQSPIPIYAIGFSTLPSSQRSTYLEALNRIAAVSGGLYIEGSSLPEAYQVLRDAIRRVFLVRLACPYCQLSNQSQPLEMTYTTGSASRTDRLAVNLMVQVPTQTQEEPLWKQILGRISLKIALSVVLAIGVVIAVPVVVITRMRKKPDPTPPVIVPVKPVITPLVVVTPPPDGRKIELTVLSGNERGRVDKVTLSSKLVIGRDKKCDVSYPADLEMSGKHFELSRAGARVEVQDLGSTNGTLLNGAQLVTQQRIEDGDWIRAGLTEVRINFGA